MSKRFRTFIFSLYEQPRLRNWFYTLAFAIFVPVGLRFAMLAWNFGDWYDRPLAVIAGTFIGITAVVPRQTMSGAGPAPGARSTETLKSSDVFATAKFQAARNRQLARDAASLGSTRR